MIVSKQTQSPTHPGDLKRSTELPRLNRYGIRDVVETVCREGLSFRQRRYRDRSAMAPGLNTSDFHRFVGLDMRTQTGAEVSDAPAHALGILLHALNVKQEGGGWERFESHVECRNYTTTGNRGSGNSKH